MLSNSKEVHIKGYIFFVSSGFFIRGDFHVFRYRFVFRMSMKGYQCDGSTMFWSHIIAQCNVDCINFIALSFSFRFFFSNFEKKYVHCVTFQRIV